MPLHLPLTQHTLFQSSQKRPWPARVPSLKFRYEVAYSAGRSRVVMTRPVRPEDKRKKKRKTLIDRNQLPSKYYKVEVRLRKSVLNYFSLSLQKVTNEHGIQYH